jgi:hypothetical protein
MTKGVMTASNGRTILLGAALALAAAPAAAWAQTPGGDGTEVGGSVPSYLELILGKPGTAFTTFPRVRTYSTSFKAVVTATDSPTLLTLADGDASSGARRGHLASGARRLPLPLEVRVGKSAFQRLDAAVDPLLTRWNEAITRKTATVKLRQKVRSKAAGAYHKVVLVTASSQTP